MTRRKDSVTFLRNFLWSRVSYAYGKSTGGGIETASGSYLRAILIMTSQPEAVEDRGPVQNIP
jgi:hypothetical protein